MGFGLISGSVSVMIMVIGMILLLVGFAFLIAQQYEAKPWWTFFILILGMAFLVLGMLVFSSALSQNETKGQIDSSVRPVDTVEVDDSSSDASSKPIKKTADTVPYNNSISSKKAKRSTG